MKRRSQTGAPPKVVVLLIVQDTSHAQKASVFSSLSKSLEHSC